MRPPELDVTFTLQAIHCSATEDTAEDEPYLWNLGFKVDADTIGPPPSGSLVPSLGVQVVPGPPFFAHVAGAGGMESGDTLAIAPQLGTRSLRLKPALLDVVGWFPGIAGIITLLWDEDGMSPATAEAGRARFTQVLGPALSAQINALVGGGAYDAELVKDAKGVPLPGLPAALTIQQRLDRLADPAGRANAVKAIVKAVKDEVIGAVRGAVVKAANWDELIDPDDLLGAEAQVFLGNELRAGARGFDMRFTEEEADYGIHGVAVGRPAARIVLDAVVLRADRTLENVLGLWRRVCWGPMRLYWAQASTVASTTRFSLRPVLGPAPSAVRWFIDDTPLAAGTSTLSVVFKAADGQVSGPADPLASRYPGGPGTLTVAANGPVLDVSFPGGLGFFLGRVRALYAYPGDPTLFPVPQPPVADLMNRGYDLEAELAVAGVEVVMDDQYREDVRQCMLTVREIDAKRIPVDWGRGPIGPGDPPNWREAIEDARVLGRMVAGVGGMDVAMEGPPLPSRRRLAVAT